MKQIAARLIVLLSLTTMSIHSMEIDKPLEKKEEYHERFPLMTKKEAAVIGRITEGGRRTLIQKPEAGYPDEFQNLRKIITNYIMRNNSIVEFILEKLPLPCKILEAVFHLSPFKFCIGHDKLIVLNIIRRLPESIDLNDKAWQINPQPLLKSKAIDARVLSSDKKLLAIKKQQKILIYEMNSLHEVRTYLETQLSLEQALYLNDIYKQSAAGSTLYPPQVSPCLESLNPEVIAIVKEYIIGTDQPLDPERTQGKKAKKPRKSTRPCIVM